MDWREARSLTWADGSRGNGAAVRVGPLACIHPTDDALLARRAADSAALTHAHDDAIAGAVLFALAVAAVLRCPEPRALDPLTFLDGVAAHAGPEYGRRLAVCAAMLARTDATATDAASEIGHGPLAVESVCLAVYAFARWHDCFEATVVNATRLGGDTDSIGALAGTLAGALHGVTQIPATWLAALENGHRGRDFATALAARLAMRTEFPPSGASG